VGLPEDDQVKPPKGLRFPFGGTGRFCPFQIRRFEFMVLLTLNGNKIAWNPARCIGCGLCVFDCATGSIKLERAAEEQVVVPPETYAKLMTVIVHQKAKTFFYK
jgi:NAD-dependent dihydropyrimidine dehydrogenase PreA subunit